jgi:glycosyltransferase involved in cell wall biosynthesis
MAPGTSWEKATPEELIGASVRVVHVPFGYFPDVVGGTEVYVAQLARDLRDLGVESVVAAPADGAAATSYEHEGTPVYRFQLRGHASTAELYGIGDEIAAEAIAAILHDVRADVLHLHAFTRAASVQAMRAARRTGSRVVFTYHTPTASCVRGTLLHNGHDPCDGDLIAQRCAACLLESRGLPLAISEVLSRAPLALGAAMESVGVSRSVVTAVRARELTSSRHSAFRQLLAECDAVVAVCEWVRSLLLRAGAPSDRLVLSRQGTPTRSRPQRALRPPGADLHLAYVGRLHPTKGVHVVLRALAANRDLRLTLDVFGVTQDVEGEQYRKHLVSLSDGDSRVRFRAPLAFDDVVETVASYDATIVPSQWLETGPLTVLESFAAGTPVIGSNLGGIAELVTHDRDGCLVAHSDPDAWALALRRLAADRLLLDRLRAGIRPPRSTQDVARDMLGVYGTIAGLPTGSSAIAGVA